MTGSAVNFFLNLARHLKSIQSVNSIGQLISALLLSVVRMILIISGALQMCYKFKANKWVITYKPHKSTLQLVHAIA